MKRFVFVLAGVVLLSACGSGLARRGDADLRYVDYAGDPVDEIRSMRNISGWTPVSRNQLVIWTGLNEAWLIKVWDGCYNLSFANAIQVTRTGYTISRFDKVLVEKESCPIVEMRPVDVARLKADRKAARDTTPRDPTKP
ncbi:MAG: DUF6491 family protein [Gammaproteobacteria bacterium]